MSRRATAFIVVGIVGFIVQVTVLSALARAGWPIVLATALAVEAAVLHNFCWHERWTWRNRRDATPVGSRLLRFHGANGLVSVVTNVVLTSLLTHALGWPPVAANTAAVVASSIVNFLVADRWVFARTTAVAVLAMSVSLPSAALAVTGPSRDALEAWAQHVRQTEKRVTPFAPASCTPGAEPAGGTDAVPGGNIHEWTGCVVVPGATVSGVVHALLDHGTPPPQDDVLESRLLSRQGNVLRTYIKLIRRTILTVIYETEHEMTFTQQSPNVWTARSVATRIAEADGGDHGFLWRLHWYWTYTQQGQDVRIDMVSISLSRDVPLLARPIAGALITRVGRESVTRTMTSLREFLVRACTAGTPRPTASPSAQVAVARRS